jgi:hypothetical protein
MSEAARERWAAQLPEESRNSRREIIGWVEEATSWKGALKYGSRGAILGERF